MKQLGLAALVLLIVVLVVWLYMPRPAKASGFRPMPASVCSTGPAIEIENTDPRGAAGTVVWTPYATQSRVSLERSADTPEVATPPNPVTGIGNTAAVRRMGDRYRRGEELTRSGIYGLQPGQPGYMEAVGDSSTSVLAAVSRRSPAAVVARPTCNLAITDLDAEFVTDGYYGDALLASEESRHENGRHVKDGMTSERATRMNTLTASRTGLGSTRRDPRFEPGPEWRVPGGDASWSHGGHAGGPTSGAFASALFAPPANWDTNYVAGFGDPNDLYGRDRTAEVVVEEPSTWTH